MQRKTAEMLWKKKVLSKHNPTCSGDHAFKQQKITLRFKGPNASFPPHFLAPILKFLAHLLEPSDLINFAV